MKAIGISLSILLLLPNLPARADFQYTNSSKMTGGSLYGAMKFASHFSKKGQNPLDPTITTYYVKGNRMRTDNPDGRAVIIDLDGRRVISIDMKKRTYSVATFDEIKAALQQAEQQLQQVQQPTPPPTAKPEDTQVTVKPKFQITPGTGSRIILGQPTTETKMEMDMLIQAQNNGPASGTSSDPSGQPSGLAPGQTASGTMIMNMDMYVAPTLPGYQELGEFYVRMGKELDWVPPTNIHVDPRFSEGMDELQKNSAAMRGLPLLENISMGMSVPPGQEQPNSAASGSSGANSSQPSAPPSSDSTPTTASGAAVKALGGLFGRKKQQNNPPPAQTSTTPQQGAPAGLDDSPAPAANSTPNSVSLIEMTIEVTSFSDSSIDGAVFDIPGGFAQIKATPLEVMGGGPRG